MGLFSQLFASAIGGFIAGYFVVVGVKLQFGSQSVSALRVLMAEVKGNAEVAIGMTRSRTYSPGSFPLGERSRLVEAFHLGFTVAVCGATLR
jgi:hypothetical protein